MVAKTKIISNTTEVVDKVGPRVDVNKDFSRLPKSYQDPQPNDAGQPVAHAVHQKAAKAGMAKGGITY